MLPRVVAPPERVEVVLRVTWVLPVLRGVLEERVIVLGLLTVELERSLDDLLTWGVTEVLRLVLELLRVTCGVAEVLRLVLELLRVT